MLACGFQALRFATHTHRPIVDFRHVSTIPCFVLNCWAQGSLNWRPQIHTAKHWTMLCPTPPTVHWLLVFFSFTENLRSPHFAATCGPALKPNCRGCGPKTPRRSCSTYSCPLSHSFLRLSKLLRQIFNNLQASLQDTDNNRQHMIAQAGGKRTVMHTHTQCSTKLLTQRREFPKAC